MGPRVWLVAFLLSSAWAADRDALAISANIQARHFPYSTILDPIFDSPTGNTIVGYTRCGDSAIWTGHYLAAEAFRYNVTGSPDALANARRAVAGLQGLVDVTGNDSLARCAVPETSPYAQGIQSEEAANGIHHTGTGTFWVGNTSRDQYSGALFGLGVAYDLIGDAALDASVASLITRMVQFLVDHGWMVGSTTFLDRPDQQLAFLLLARHVNPSRFSAAYQQAQSVLGPLMQLPVVFDTLSDSSYFKFNLDSINLFTLLRLDGGATPAYRQAYATLRKHTAGQANAFFNMIDSALNGPDPARDAETRVLLGQWLLRPRRDRTVNNAGKYPTCGDPQTACSPIPVPDRVPTDFLWQRSPYQMSGGGSGVIEGAGIDYILPWWIARYYRVVEGGGLPPGLRRRPPVLR